MSLLLEEERKLSARASHRVQLLKLQCKEDKLALLRIEPQLKMALQHRAEANSMYRDCLRDAEMSASVIEQAVAATTTT